MFRSGPCEGQFLRPLIMTLCAQPSPLSRPDGGSCSSRPTSPLFAILLLTPKLDKPPRLHTLSSWALSSE